jgi:AcrR family transcriptional regulator
MLFSNSDEKTQRILSGAKEVFLRFGYNRTTMRDIAEAAKISRPALYQVYKNKEKVYEALMDSITSEMFASIRDELLNQRSLEDKINFAVATWAVAGFRMLRGNSNVKDMSNLELPPVRQMYDDMQKLVIEILPKQKPQAKPSPSNSDYARALIFSTRGLKDTAKSEADLRNLIRIQVSQLIAVL